ncbi:hypothetical protein Y919_07330 [Caloranaerobacter azorensis H53214]|uniref:Uncharacterized protein n=2 Tax=Caloranaerobacter azorensis TaxID=116090 RepID=A0A1M5R459_9FIRM|nr:hypothetical protein [Caloranaerobacter azorensis]KGG80250.1 hypothetical protein Y919_07330 [Caloranaerobacter azorensis H53214]SHH21195.1 hypothetical protein SAMN02745135_00081 [Caloranaerobacter azorensis DSM 13643]
MRIFLQLLVQFFVLTGPIFIYLNHIYILKNIKKDESIYIRMWLQSILIFLTVGCFIQYI